MEKDPEIDGGNLDFGARMYDSRIGRWWSVDPLVQFISSQYKAFLNNPVLHIDPNGAWIPGVDRNGKIYLIREEGDDRTSLSEFFGYDENEKRWLTSTQYLGKKTIGMIRLSENNNYSKAFKYAYSEEHKDDFFDVFDENERAKRGYNRNNRKEFTNYNCYHFAINGVWEKEIYTENSYGEFYFDVDDINGVLDEYFEEVDESKAIVGETIVSMNYSGGIPQHTAVYMGKDNEGNVYILEKPGDVAKPQLRKLLDPNDSENVQYKDYKFHNEKAQEEP